VWICRGLRGLSVSLVGRSGGTDVMEVIFFELTRRAGGCWRGPGPGPVAAAGKAPPM
jgi:hypothetical protein